jgi:hypothetical protein
MTERADLALSRIAARASGSGMRSTCKTRG